MGSNEVPRAVVYLIWVLMAVGLAVLALGV
jgi:hypothetical protein